MAEIIGKITGYSPLNNYNQYYSSKNMKKLSPAFLGLTAASLAVRSSVTFGRRKVIEGQQRCFKTQPAAAASDHVMMCFGNGKCLKWWEKDLKPNMKEMAGAADLVDSLLTAGDKLVIVNFFSPGCGGCKALHPKICQLAEMNPEIQFLQVNHEEHKSMCYSLNVRVLPFFRFYRGAHGCVCSFSCTNATIKKFKDALAKHIPDRCSLGPPKGLEEKELVALGSNLELSFTYPPKPNLNPNRIAKDNTCTYRSRL